MGETRLGESVRLRARRKQVDGEIVTNMRLVDDGLMLHVDMTAPSASAQDRSTITLEPDLHLVVTPYASRRVRLFDIAVASAALVITSPVMMVLAIATKLDSRGPVFFRQVRSGRSGVPFTIFKFRTMCVDSDDVLVSLLDTEESLRSEFADLAKLTQDPRVSRIGRRLRPSGLDELPQLFNVLRGDMSIVGPRPLSLGEEERYGRKAGLLWSVKPGLTGLWQLSGRNDTTYEERVELDIAYVRMKSVASDIRLFRKTVALFLTGRLSGGY